MSSTVIETIADSVISESFAHEVDLPERLLQFESTHKKYNLSFPNESYLTRVQHPFLTVALERYDRVASLSSIEPRHPILDKRLIDFYMGLPWNQFMREGWSKFLFRQVAEQFVPREVAWRTGKEHVGWQFTKELLSHKKDIFFSINKTNNDTINKIVRPEFTLEQFKKGGQNIVSVKSAFQADIAGVALWLNNI